MTTTITLFEHDKVKFDWDDQDLAVLERLNRATGGEILRATVDGGKRVLQASQYVGVIRFRKQTIQVLPKMYRDEITDWRQQVREATRNLLHMLAYAGQFPVLLLGHISQSHIDESRSDCLVESVCGPTAQRPSETCAFLSAV